MKGLFIMKQDLWLINSSLLIMSVCIFAAYELLKIEPAPWKAPISLLAPEVEKKKDLPKTAPSWEKIYQDDMFGTYIAQEVKAVQQSLVTPIPEPKPPVIPTPPEPKKQEFITPLNITLRGVIASGNEFQNVAMIADETNKEGMYHLGEKIKDGQIIKIATNRIIILRANGQQEIFYLRKNELAAQATPEEKWKYIVKKINDQTFNLDPDAFAKEYETLGNFIEQLAVIGTAYHDGKPIGIRLGKPTQDVAPKSLGLLENDILLSINNIDLAEPKNRIKAFDALTQLNLNDVVTLGIKRANKDISLSYKLVKIERPRKSLFPGIKMAEQAGAQPTTEEPFKLSRLQQREQTQRDFNQVHPLEQQRQQQAMMDIRKRILENLQQRFQNRNR